MEKRNGFNSKLGFILAAAGSSVGLGNLWSFPYKTSQNGGASFVIVYIISVIVLGSILSIAEVFVGKRAEANAVSAYKKIRKNFGWVGLLSIVIALFITFYYVVLGGYTIKYTVNSFSNNTNTLESFSSNIGLVILYTAIFLIIAVVIISFGVKKGIENASKILMPALIVILIGIVIYCLCLGNGVKEGLNYYLNPDFKALGFKGVLAAMSQAFFSLSTGAGVLLAYGSYAGKDVKIGSSVLWIAFFDTFVALLAGLAIFPAIYHYKAETGIELQNNGIVLLFSSMPIVFGNLGVIGKIVSFLFFGMVSIAAITSVISILEVVSQYLIQRFKLKRVIASTIAATLSFLVSIPIGISLGFELSGKESLRIAGRNLLDVFDLITTSVFIPISCLFLALASGWFMYKYESKKDAFSIKLLSENYKKDGMDLGWFSKIYSFIIKYLAPLLILLIEIFGIVDIIFPKIGDTRVFSLSGLTIELIAISILGLIIFIYFVFLKNKETGNNSDELKTKEKGL